MTLPIVMQAPGELDAELAAIAALARARGDIIRGGASAWERHALAANGTFFTSDGTDAKWDYAPQTPSGFRLSLTTALAVTTADVTAAATLYLTPYSGNWVYIFDGTGFARRTASELSLALDSNSGHTNYHQSGKNFDAFAFIASGAVDIGSGPAWSSNTARGTGASTTELELYNGVYVNKNAITLRFGTASGDTVIVAARQATYLGSFRCTANGQTEDSLAKRLLWNVYNRVPRVARRLESTVTWTYSTLAFRQANANAANQIEFLRGLNDDAMQAHLLAHASHSAGGAILAQAAFGLDSTSAAAAGQIWGAATLTSTGRFNIPVAYHGFPGLGYHYLAWLEIVTASGTTTWYGVDEFGISGEVLA